MAPDPTCVQHFHRVEREVLTLADGDSDDLVDKINAGYLLYFGILLDNPDAEVQLQMDGQPEPTVFYSANRLGDMGLDNRISHHLYLERYDVVAGRYAIVYVVDTPEPFSKRLRVSIRNRTGGPINIIEYELKTWIIGEPKKERGD